MEKNYDIWVEGYGVMEGQGAAWCAGSAQAETFKDACIKLASKGGIFRGHFDPERMTWWGCRLYDNAADARKAFG